MTAPAVSVIVATYNGAALVGETLAALSRQTFADFEVIVVDDCSTDDTRAVVAAFPDPRVRLVPLAVNGGPVRTRNHAVSLARGRHIAALDQDDLCHPDRLARQVAYLDAHPDVALVASAADVLTERGAVLPPRGTRRTTPGLIAWMLRLGNPLVWSSVMIRGDAARALAPFSRHELLYAEDFDIYHRVSRIGRVARIDDALLTYRSHAGGVSQRYEDVMHANARRVLAAANAPLLGAASEDAADLLVRHLVHGEPVDDAAALRRLGTHLGRLHAAHPAIAAPDARDRALIERHLHQRWRTVVRTGLRAGTLRLRDTMAASTLPTPERIDRLAWHRLIGRVRRARRAQALAA